jgi:hypothetical protein
MPIHKPQIVPPDQYMQPFYREHRLQCSRHWRRLQGLPPEADLSPGVFVVERDITYMPAKPNANKTVTP